MCLGCKGTMVMTDSIEDGLRSTGYLAPVSSQVEFYIKDKNSNDYNLQLLFLTLFSIFAEEILLFGKTKTLF